MLLLLMTGSAFKLNPLQKQKQNENRPYPPRTPAPPETVV